MITVEMLCQACDEAYGKDWEPRQAEGMLRALQAVAPMIREECAVYCEENAMGMSVRRDGPFAGWRASQADPIGTHPGKGYAAALRALKVDAR